MRVESVATAKRGKAHANTQRIPRAGTRLRAVYDLFQANKGSTIRLPPERRGRTADIRRQLTDYYGLDIRKVTRSQYILVGEWFGKVYVDYLAQQIAASETH